MSQLTKRIDRFPRFGDLQIIMEKLLNREFWSEVYKAVVMKHYSGRGPWLMFLFGMLGFMIEVINLPSRLSTRLYQGKHSYGWILYGSCCFLLTIVNLENDLHAIWEFIKALGLTIWGIFST